MKAEEQKDLDLETVQLRRSLAVAEVRADRLDMENLDLQHNLKEAREQIAIREASIADLEVHTETLIMTLKAKADETEEVRRELETTQAVLAEKSDTIEGLVESLMTAKPR